MELGKRRAEAIRDLLVQEGVTKECTEVFSYGEEWPVADNGTTEGRQKNRRVEIKITPGE